MEEKSFPSWLSFEKPNNKKKKLTKLPKIMKKTRKPRKKAVIIGIDYIGLGPEAELKSCVNDAKNVKRFLLEKKFKNSASTMLMLLDTKKDHRYRPTKENILKAFRWLVAGASAGDTLFFHYAGHGDQVGEGSQNESDGKDEGIYPVDYKENKYICDDTIRKELVEKVPKDCRLFALIDCCTSGTMLDLVYNWGYMKSWERESVKAQNPILGDVILFASCHDNEKSRAVTYTNKKKQGLMTSAFISCIRHGPNKTIDELIKAITIEVHKGDENQNPQLSASQFWDPEKRILDFNKYRDKVGNSEKKIVDSKRNNDKFGEKTIEEML